MRSKTEFVAPPGGVSPAKPPPRLARKEFTMSTLTITRVERTVMNPRAATTERNIAQSSLREARMASIISCRCIEENHYYPLLVLCRLVSSARSSNIFGNGQMLVMRTVEDRADSLGQLVSREQPLGLYHLALAVDPL